MRRLAVFLCTAALLAQDDTFTVDTKLVVVNVSIKDKSGRVITNLKKEDFQLSEDGVAQKIAVFDFQELSGEPLAPLSFAQRPPTQEERRQLAATAPAPQRVDPKTLQDHRLIGLFFDMSSMQQLEQSRAVEAATKFVQSQMTAADLVSIMTFSSKFKVIQDFTGDRDLLLSTIRDLALGDSADLATMATIGTADEGDDSGSFVADNTEFNIFNTDRKLTALEDAAKKLAPYPEKKALIYFSSGVEKTGAPSQLRQTRPRAQADAGRESRVAFVLAHDGQAHDFCVQREGK